MGIDYDGEEVIDSGGGGCRHDGDEGGGGDRVGYNIDRSNNDSQQQRVCDANDSTHDGKMVKNGIDSNSDDEDGTNDTIDKENISSKRYHFINEKDELVLDILNDDLIAKVRGKITR